MTAVVIACGGPVLAAVVLGFVIGCALVGNR